MESRSSVKVPEGKMVEVSVKFDNTIEEVSLTGDFFLEPPEARKEMERKIEGMKASATRKEIQEVLEKVEAETIGFSRAHVAEAVKEAIEG